MASSVPTSAGQTTTPGSSLLAANGTGKVAGGGTLTLGMDGGAVLRMTYVLVVLGAIIAAYITVKVCRYKRSRSRVRRYDVLSAKQLQPELVVDSEGSDDELFAVDDDSRRLVDGGGGGQQNQQQR